MTLKAQITNTILMIRPVNFRYNEQTAVNNYYQKIIDKLNPAEAQFRALMEFDEFVKNLRGKGINVIVVDDTKDPQTPDSIFPNNWISFHEDGRAVLYPMFAENRRLERRPDILEMLEKQHDLRIIGLENLAMFEEEGKYLEGTGSVVLDRTNGIAYAAISGRTNPQVLDEFCNRFDYEAVTFVANQTVNGQRMPIYHTNVMMCVADEFAIVCIECIDNQIDRKNVLDSLRNTGKEIIEINEEQVNHFAGNMLQVRSDTGLKYLAMSSAACQSLTTTQRDKIGIYNDDIIHSSLDTIEALGGGSARCMMAEVFLPAVES